jgi:hypothetical protein
MSSWEAKLQRRREFCERFVAEHHPGMVDAHKIKGARPLLPLDGPRYLRDGPGDMAEDWWLQTDDSISAVGIVWLAHLFGRHRLYGHASMIGRSDQESWALVSEPYSPPSILAMVEELGQRGSGQTPASGYARGGVLFPRAGQVECGCG